MGKKRRLESDHERKSERKKKHKVCKLRFQKQVTLATSTHSVSLMTMPGNNQNLHNSRLWPTETG